MSKIYVPDTIPADYKYITNINDTYFDIYNVSNTNNKSGIFYRIYYGLDYNIIEERTYNNTIYGGTNTLQIERTNDILARKDISNICITSFSIIFLILFLVNIMSSILRKGGMFGDIL